MQAQLSESLLDFAEWLLSNAADLWPHASVGNKTRRQSVLFAPPLLVSATGFGAARSATFYRELQECAGNQEKLASPGGTVSDERELAALEEHLLVCADCIERADETRQFVGTMKTVLAKGMGGA
jgi:hypothetical protein